jgi:hypothetical protein
MKHHQKQRKPRATITDKEVVLACLVVLNLIALLVTFLVHQRLAAPDEIKGLNPNIALKSLQTKFMQQMDVRRVL